MNLTKQVMSSLLEIADGSAGDVPASKIVLNKVTLLSNAEKYANRIKNTDKKKYALDLINWVKKGSKKGSEPKSNNLSFMAAQAVRMELEELIGVDI